MFSEYRRFLTVPKAAVLGGGVGLQPPHSCGLKPSPGSKRVNGIKGAEAAGTGEDAQHKRRARVRMLVFADTFAPGSGTFKSCQKCKKLQSLHGVL